MPNDLLLAKCFSLQKQFIWRVGSKKKTSFHFYINHQTMIFFTWMINGNERKYEIDHNFVISGNNISFQQTNKNR